MKIKIFDLGLIDFNYGWSFQRQVFSQVREGLLEGGIIFCQHYPVITLGRKGNLKNLLVSFKYLKEKKIDFFYVERGGDITYHGPGQILIYPIINLSLFKKDIHYFLRFLEKIIVEFLKEIDIPAYTCKGFSGVWTQDKKISSIGIAIKNWISFYGLSLNIKDNDLDNFSLIRPCGMNISMTSIETILKRTIKLEEIKARLKLKFEYNFSDTKT